MRLSCILFFFFGMQLLQHHAFVALLSQYALHGYRYPFLYPLVFVRIYEYFLFAWMMCLLAIVFQMNSRLIMYMFDIEYIILKISLVIINPSQFKEEHGWFKVLSGTVVIEKVWPCEEFGPEYVQVAEQSWILKFGGVFLSSLCFWPFVRNMDGKLNASSIVVALSSAPRHPCSINHFSLLLW